MKSLHFYILAIGLFMHSVVSAQIQSVSLQARGLTCSMCSRAIYKSIQKVPGVSKIKEDIEHSSYHILFSDPAQVSLENLKKAVLDAGFSVGWMEVKANFDHIEVGNDSVLEMGGMHFSFVDVSNQTLSGEKKLLVVDKDYLDEKDRKKYAGIYQSGSIANKSGNIIHVTLSKS